MPSDQNPGKHPHNPDHQIPGFLGLRRDFIGRVTEGLAQLQQAIEHNDYPSIRKFGHNLKGTGAPFGFPEITEFGRSLENGAQATDAGAVRGAAARLVAYLDELKFE